MLSGLRQGVSLAVTGLSYLMAGAFLVGLVVTLIETSQAMISP
ncbi:hypothetical protein [Methylobacterium gossipiicola]|uniref:Uncharacterized protein n=1 Tax=Methylobacterium gossipiicola TaxID=582675 RepID=A0A1I2QQT2_9HYPH|nr:hypothetical protein [Methylobacterium gossipiicola]SFG29639.1 hypothetical protein SAMN05192565_101251 [Methylobacterium gossipiicola]